MTIRRHPKFLILAALLIFTAFLVLVRSSVRADTVVMKDGTVIEGKIIAKGSTAIMIKILSGRTEHVSMKDVETITRGPVKRSTRDRPAAAEKARTTRQRASRRSAAAARMFLDAMDPAKRKQFEKDVKGRFAYMEKEPLELWPASEPRQRLGKNDPPKMNWKVMKKNGATEFLDSRPDPNQEYRKVWCKFRPTIMIMEHHIGLGIIDKTPPVTWGRMYWHPKTGSWGASHPHQLAFMHDQDYAIGLLETIEREINAKAADQIRSLWYDLLNARAGAPKDEATVLASIRKDMNTLKNLAYGVGRQAGLGDLLWRAHRINMDVEARINKSTTMKRQISQAKERRVLLQRILTILFPPPE